MKDKRIKSFIGYLMAITGLVIAILTNYTQRFNNPDLSETRIFLENFFSYTIGIVMFIVGMWLTRDEKTDKNKTQCKHLHTVEIRRSYEDRYIKLVCH